MSGMGAARGYPGANTVSQGSPGASTSAADSNEPLTEASAEQQKVADERRQSMVKSVELMREIKDAESAERLAPQLKQTLLEGIAAVKRLSSINNPNKSQEAAIQKKFNADMAPVMNDYMKELSRIQSAKGADVLTKMFVDLLKESGISIPATNGVPQGNSPANGAPGSGSPGQGRSEESSEPK